jgi:hypothetical protein
VKRLTFKPEFVPALLSGDKRITIRKTHKKLPKVGETISAVSDLTNAAGRRVPGFLVPAKLGFAKLKIKSVYHILCYDIDKELADMACSSVEFYKTRYLGSTHMTVIEFEVIK